MSSPWDEAVDEEEGRADGVGVLLLLLLLLLRLLLLLLWLLPPLLDDMHFSIMAFTPGKGYNFSDFRNHFIAWSMSPRFMYDTALFLHSSATDLFASWTIFIYYLILSRLCVPDYASIMRRLCVPDYASIMRRLCVPDYELIMS